MALFCLSYLIIGGGLAWACRVRKPLSVAACLIGWPIITVIVLIDMAADWDGR